MKYYIPILCVVLLGLGAIVGAHYKENEFGGLIEQNIIWQSALETRLHTVVLTRLREGKTKEAIKTLENSLGVKEALLETCQSPSCIAASSREVKEAKELIQSYRKSYPSKEQQ
jgi:hypothetical protein